MRGRGHDRGSGTQMVWPWESEPEKAARVWTRARPRGSWPLTAATLAVLAGGYAWLGSAFGGPSGALIGCAAGLALSALLRLLVETATSGPPRVRHRGPGLPLSRRARLTAR